MKILVINAGSSSLKYQLMDPDTGDVVYGVAGFVLHEVANAPAEGATAADDKSSGSDE